MDIERSFIHFLSLYVYIYFVSAEMAAAAGPKRTRQTYTRYQTLELEKVTTRTIEQRAKNEKIANKQSTVSPCLSILRLQIQTSDYQRA